MNALQKIALIVIVTLLTVGCGGKRLASLDGTRVCYEPRYAKGFTILADTLGGGTIIRITNPYQSDTHFEQLLYLCDEGTPQPTNFDGVVVAEPVRRIAVLSSSFVAMLDAIGCVERVVGVSGLKFITNESIRRAAAENRVGEIGYDSNMNFEQIAARRTDIALLYGLYGEDAATTAKLRELGIPYLYIGDYVENEPLGKAEWMVALGYLCGCEERAIAEFAAIEQRYIAIRDRKYCSAYKPRVMLNLPYRDTWFMPSKHSYAVRLIEDAGGEYIYPQNETPSSVPIATEEALLLASKADFWLNVGQVTSLDELRAVAPRFAEVDAVRFGRTYNNNRRTSATGGSDFWESGAVRPDVVLSDIVKILHSEAPTDSLYYYRQLE